MPEKPMLSVVSDFGRKLSLLDPKRVDNIMQCLKNLHDAKQQQDPVLGNDAVFEKASLVGLLAHFLF